MYSLWSNNDAAGNVYFYFLVVSKVVERYNNWISWYSVIRELHGVSDFKVSCNCSSDWWVFFLCQVVIFQQSTSPVCPEASPVVELMLSLVRRSITRWHFRRLLVFLPRICRVSGMCDFISEWVWYSAQHVTGYFRHEPFHMIALILTTRLGFKTCLSKTRLKTYKTNTGSPWLGWTVTYKKNEKVMASRKSSIPVVAHSKQQNIILCLTTVLFWQLPLIIAVYQTLACTHNISKVQCLIDS